MSATFPQRMMGIWYTHAFNGISLLFRDVNLSRTRGQRLVIIRFLTQELQELFLILTNELRDLGVSSGDLLKDGLEHLWLLLDQLTKLLEVGIIAKKFETREFSATSTSSSSSSSLLATSLSGSLEQVDRFVVTSGRSAFGSSSLGCASGSGLLLLFLLNVLGDTLLKVSAKSGNPWPDASAMNSHSKGIQ